MRQPLPMLRNGSKTNTLIFSKGCNLEAAGEWNHDQAGEKSVNHRDRGFGV